MTKKTVKINGEEITEPVSLDALKKHLGHKERTPEELEVVRQKLYDSVATAPDDTEQEYKDRVTAYADNLEEHYKNASRYNELELIRVYNQINAEFDDFEPLPEPDTTGLWLPYE